MRACSVCFAFVGAATFGLVTIGFGMQHAPAADPLRNQAVVNYTFDEVSGDAYDSGAAGVQKDHGQLANGATRVDSPFWNRAGGQALLFDASRQQLLVAADSPDLDLTAGLSLSCYFLNLHPSSDDQMHGLVAKRAPDAAGSVTNYGINFQPKSDLLQLYVNHGSGYRVATYSFGSAIGYRRRVFLTATMAVGDSPEPDADTDQDDLVLRLYANGQPVAPTNAANGTAAGADVWLTDVNFAGLANDVPLTIGGSHTGLEPLSGLVDEFSLFPRALAPEEVAALFAEVAGSNGAELAQQEITPAGRPAAPVVSALSLRGLQMGQTTRLTIAGQAFDAQAKVELPIGGVTQAAVEGSNANQLIVDITLPPGIAPGLYPLHVRTAGGLSNATPIAVDNLPQLVWSQTSAEAPATLPAAFSGVLAGDQQARVYFRATAGDRVVADVESRRLGAPLDPVIEIKSAAGTPRAIEWGHVALKGDARAEIKIPEDGVYFVELHDLSYRAAGESPFRLKIGDLRIVDAYFPPAAPAGSVVDVEPLGSGIPSGSLITANLNATPDDRSVLLAAPPDLAASGATPALGISSAIEVVETDIQQVSAKFVDAPHVPVVINGRISMPGEVDRYLLDVTPGQTLEFLLMASGVNSPLDGQFSVLTHPKQQPLATSADMPGSRDRNLTFAVPADVRQVQIAVRDLFDKGGSGYVYRLRVRLAGQPDYQLAITSPRIALPESGTAIVRMQINRAGYGGPINLRVIGDDHVTISPAQLPAEGGSRAALLTLTRTAGGAEAGLSRLRIVGESEGLAPPLVRVATVNPDAGQIALAGYDDVLPAAVTGNSDLAVEVTSLPPTLFKGIGSEVAVKLNRGASLAGKAVRYSLVSTEAARNVDAKDPSKGQLPLIRALAEQVASAGASTDGVRIAVPLDVAEAGVDFAIRADVVPHPYSDAVLATAYSAPFRLGVRDAVGFDFEPKNLALTSQGTATIKGTITRAEGFAGPVDVAIAGLPTGYSATRATVAADQTAFEITVTAAQEAAAKDVPNVAVSIEAPGIGPIAAPRGVPVNVQPGKQ